MAGPEDRGVRGESSDVPVAVGDLAFSGSVDAASWLTDDALLMVGWFSAKFAQPLEAWLADQNRLVPLDVRFVAPYARPDAPGGNATAGVILIVGVPEAQDDRQVHGHLVIRSGDSTFALNPRDTSTVLQDLDLMVRAQLGGLDPATRRSVRAALLSALGEGSRISGDPGLGQAVRAVEDALGDLPSTSMSGEDAPGGSTIQIESMVALDETSFYVRGWVDEEFAADRLTAISPEGSHVELLPGAFRHRRTDSQDSAEALADSTYVAKPGFVSYFQFELPTYSPNGWILQAANAAGGVCEASVPPIVRDVYAARDAVLDSLRFEQPWAEELKRNHASPAIKRLQQRHRELARIDCTFKFGIVQGPPEVSIIVPLFRRIDVLEHQMAQFVHDQQIHDVELIYVLDSPELADRLRVMAGEMFELYRVPFQTVLLERNVGYSSANNIGVAHSTGRIVLLLNSDVFPERPGWLGNMTTFYDATPGIGALGAKLLYEDGSLQHAGMFFFQWPGSGVWDSMHYFAGHDRYLPAANVTRLVPAVTGACLMIERALYDQVGGLSPDYVRGGYEDAELCLRLLEAGRENWYLPEVELYHLEAQSYRFSQAPSSSSREMATQYNRWLHSTRWKESMEAVMARYASTPSSRPTEPSADGSSLGAPSYSPAVAASTDEDPR